jgi:hypothetical protein
MRFVHSRGNLGLFLGDSVLDRRGNLWCSIELGEFVLPWPMRLHVPLDVLHQIAEAFPLMIPCALVVDIADHPLNGVGTRTVRR